ncbi:large ribosomal subunit protein mL54 [Aulostomus maculatus]
MAMHSLFRVELLSKCINTNAAALFLKTNTLCRIQTCGYQKKVGSKSKGYKGVATQELKGPEVCKDPVKLTSYAVGVNIFKEGEDPKLKSVEEYPEWLFQLNLGPVKKLKELDQDTWGYWRRLRKEHIWRSNKLSKTKKF